MEKDSRGVASGKLALKAVVVFALASALFLAAYQYDNKYTAQNPKGINGVLTLTEESLGVYPVVFLVDGWEYYGGRLLTPADFAQSPPAADQTIFIGQFGGFEKWSGGLPHGSASYRLRIKLPQQQATYLLELPEIFSAYRLYVNGELAAQMGNPVPQEYKPQTGNRTVSIESAGDIELLFAVSDFSHLYSGIVYPPAFGQPQDVSNLLNARLVFRSLLCAVALTVGLLSLLVGLLSHRRGLPILFGLLCLFFVGYVSYPITQTLWSGSPLLYTIENVSFCAMLGIVMLISTEMSGLPRKWSIPFIAFAGVMCLATLVLHLLLPLGPLPFMLLYSKGVALYEWIAAGFIAASVLYAFFSGKRSVAPLLYGAVIFICALLADRLLPLFEPILTGWFVELASFALVLCAGVVIGQQVAAQYREKAVMSERIMSMERLYQSQLSQYQTVKEEIQHTKTLRHDLRHHLRMLEEYLQNKQYDKMGAYLQAASETSKTGEIPEYCPIDVINILTHHYQAVANRNNIRLEIRCNCKAASPPGYTGVGDADLCCLYSNLMENAVEACLQAEGQKEIRVTVFRTAPKVLHLRVWNTAENVKQNKGHFLSIKQGGGHGYGLLSIQTIAEKYKGSASFFWDEEKKQFESQVILND